MLPAKERKTSPVVVSKGCDGVGSGVTGEGEEERLTNAENDVVRIRKTMESSLFKLSAYMSQLKNENIGLENAQEYARELRRQLAETETLVAERQDKVESLRDVIRKSREEVTSCRENLLAREDECRDYGRRVRGARYNPPAVGADNISRKLAQIAFTANKVGASFFLQLVTFIFS